MAGTGVPPATKRADARLNEQKLLDAAAATFVSSGVHAPVREIAAAAGVGVGTIYRHFPTRDDLIVAVFRHQVEALAELPASLTARGRPPFEALSRWIDGFVDFLVTKHGLPEALHSDGVTLHRYFVDKLVPACGTLLDAARAAGEIGVEVEAHQLLRAVGNLCLGADDDYNPRDAIALLISGLRR